VTNGDLTVRFFLRDGDEVGELADALNVCLESLGGKIESTQKLADTLESCLSGNEGDEIKGLVMKIKENLKQFKV